MKKNTLLALILTTTIIGCDNAADPIITIDTHIDINVENFTDSLNFESISKGVPKVRPKTITDHF